MSAERDPTEVGRLHDLAAVAYLPAVCGIRAAIDDLDMTWQVRRPVKGEASYKVLAYRVLIAAFGAMLDAGYTITAPDGRQV